jgi:hypothetical protein
MGFLAKLFGVEKQEESKAQSTEISVREDVHAPDAYREESPKSLDLGWYWSENKEEYQLAKIDERDRATHFYIIGATGTGKTKLLEFLIQQDIKNGNGFGIIDPHGDLIESVKGFLICWYDEKDISEKVILIDATDPKFTVAFNPLEKLPNASIPEQVNELISSFRKIWSDSWGTRMEDLMRNSLIALGEADYTLVDLSQFLTNRSFREFVLERVSHPIAQDYFRRFESLTDRGQITWIEPIMNKINAFLSDERIRHMFSSPKSSFDLREAMDTKKIILIKLDKGKLKDAADLVGSLLMAKIQMAAFSRSDVPANKRIPFYMYIDEFQNFATESFAVVLSEARKYGLSLIMAHQTLSQIPEELRSLILGNTGIQVYFRVNRHDASLLAKEAFEYSGYEVKTMSSFRPKFWSYAEEWERKIGELQSLPPRVCYAKHKIAGGIIPFQTVEIEPAWELMGLSEAEYSEIFKSVPFGAKYLVSRDELISSTKQRQRYIREEIDTMHIKVKETTVPLKPSITEIAQPTRKKLPSPREEKIQRVELREPEKKAESQHRYLQTLIKHMAEDKGFRAVIEQPILESAGRVDVSLERDGKKIACEISLTTSEEQELSNIEKCLAAGYEKVISCSPDKKTLEKVKTLVSQKLKEPDKKKVLFLQPEELFFYLEEEAAKVETKEERVKDYKVKVQYQPIQETEKKTRKEAVAQVILGALRRMKDEK